MATIRKLRGRWQAQVRRRGSKPRAKSFDTKSEAERWARDLEAQVDRFGAAPDTRILESTALRDLLVRYRAEVTPRKRGHVQESQRIDVLLRHDLAHAKAVCRHLTDAPKQATNASSRFLHKCRRWNDEEIDDEQLRDATVPHGFKERSHSKLGWMTPWDYARAIIETTGRNAALIDGSALRPLAIAIDDGSDHDKTLAPAG